LRRWRAHTLLAEDRWRGADLRAVVEEELAAHRAGGRVTVLGPSLRLRPEAVQPLSMVLHELATNAAKYGALSVPGGRLDVSWRRNEPGEGLRLFWEERDGPALLVPPERRGFGSTLIEATMRVQLGGRVEKDWAAEGLRCEVTVAADRIAVGGEADAPEHNPPSALAGWHAAPVSLRGRAVLVVEDEPLVAMEMAHTLGELGCEVIGPAATLDEALRLAATHRPDAAVLDVNLRGRPAFPVAELLAGRGVPMIWATGYGELPPGHGAAGGMILLRKPLAEGELEAALRRAIAAGAAGPPVR
jgi:CheY-like chemotaxis protein